MTKVKTKGYSWKIRFFALLLPLGLALAVYLLFLDYQIKTHFDGDRWAIPARVYAKPLSLYPNGSVTPEQLTHELKALGYQPVEIPKRPGTWSRHKQVFVIYSRAFQYIDGFRDAEKITVKFKHNRIIHIEKNGAESLPLTRLDPVAIGSIYPSHKEDRVIVTHDEIPHLLSKALIATEDRSFYTHYGINPKGIFRAFIQNIRAGAVVQGGSTLTQQLVKNFYLTRERSYIRKLNEVLMAILLDARYEKSQILEAYANEIYLAQDGARAIHGFGLGSYFYFNRPLNELNLSRIALLVGLVKGPSYYNPRRHPERALKRRNLVLKLMADQHIISQSEYQLTKKESLGLSQQKGLGKSRRFAFLDMVKRQLRQDYREDDLVSEGLKVFSTLDIWVQKQTEAGIQSRLTKLEKWRKLPAKKLQAAVVIADNETGEVQAIAGGRDTGLSGFNRALDITRPIGSLIKPAIFLTALSQPERYTLISSIEDAPIALRGEDGKIWSPQNYEKKSFGHIPLHESLAHSHNLSTVRLGLDLGLKKVIATLHALGIRKKIRAYPSLLLGSLALSPLEVTQMYQAFSSGGFLSPLRSIIGVQNSQGEILQSYPISLRSRMDRSAVYLTNLNLQEVMREGTGKSLKKLIPSTLNVAGKTGTTNGFRDSWFAGFTGDRVATVWVGRDDNKNTTLSGASGAMQVWGDIMKRLNPQALSLMEPENVSMFWVDETRQLLASESCETAVLMPFIQGSEPRHRADCATENMPVAVPVSRSERKKDNHAVLEFFDELFE